MSQENVEIVRRFFESYRPDDPAEALAYLAPDVVYEIGQEVPARGGTRSGRCGSGGKAPGTRLR
jgi:ketosteroid isomerase-like protein